LKDNNLTFKEGIIHEDLHQHLRISCHIQSIAFSEAVTYNYRMRPGSIMKTTNEVLHQKRVFHIFADVVEQGYHNAYMLKFILNWMSTFRLTVDTNKEWMAIRDSYFTELKTLIKNLGICKRLPFSYLSLPRPWMRFKILYALADICLK
jgi:hypothetical protein